MVSVEHPFNNIPREELLKAANSMGEKAAQDFPRHLANVQKFARTFEPITTLSTIAFYGLLTGVDKEGQTRENSPIRQDQLELLQAIYVQTPNAELGQEFATPEDIQLIIEELSSLTNAYVNREMANSQRSEDKHKNSEKLLLSHLRSHTQIVRNWAFFDHAIDIAKRLLRLLDKDFEQILGLPATIVIDVFALLMRRIERRATDHIKTMRTIRKKSSTRDLIRAYYKACPYLQENPDELMTYFTENKIKINEAQLLIIIKLNDILPEVFAFSSDEIATEFRIDADALDALLAKLSIQFGDLADKKTEHIFLDNPVWHKPLIYLGERSYLCPIPSLFSGYLFRILESLMENDGKLRERYFKIRGEFLEQEVVDLFKRALPGCQIVTGYKFDIYETDLLVGIDDNLFIVEAKSHKPNPAALRGGKESAIKHIKNAIIEPSEQSLRLQHRTENALTASNKTEQLLPKFPFDLKKIKYIYRLSVTLEDFATIQSNLRLTKEAGWLPHDHVIAPCILVTDLAIVFEMLELAALKIHYLKRRSEIQQHMTYIGHELNLLGLYMKSSFSLGEHGHNGTNIIISEMSSDIDAYYTAKDAGFNAKKPRPRLHPYFKALCQKLEDREFEGWSTAAMAILSCPYETQIKALERFEAMKLSVKNRWKDPNHLNSIVIIPDKHSSEALIFHAFNNKNKPDRHKAIQNLASSAFEIEYIKTVVVISINIDSSDYPYSGVTLLGK